MRFALGVRPVPRKEGKKKKKGYLKTTCIKHSEPIGPNAAVIHFCDT